MTSSPTDANGYIGVPMAADDLDNRYPKWLYHTTKTPVIVADWAQELALVTGDSGWTAVPRNLTAAQNNWVTVTFPGTIFNTSQSYANDTAAKAAGASIGDLYINGSAIQVVMS